MEYSEYKKIRKRMESARKFVRIARTMLYDIAPVLDIEDARVQNTLDTEAKVLTGVGCVIDTCIENMDMRHAMKGKQLDLFDNEAESTETTLFNQK